VVIQLCLHVSKEAGGGADALGLEDILTAILDYLIAGGGCIEIGGGLPALGTAVGFFARDEFPNGYAMCLPEDRGSQKEED
jgi:hypothetical protein